MPSKDEFVAAMMAIQDDRAAEVGGHVWQQTLNEYGPAIMYAEIASINSRLRQLFWPGGRGISPENLRRAEDLLVDLGNYAYFLHWWVRREIEDEDDVAWIEPEASIRKTYKEEAE